MVVAVAVIFAFSFLGGTKGGGEIFLQNASAAGPDPFTPSTAGEPGTAVTPTITPNESSAPGGTLKVSGAHPGLYSGKQNEAACDVEKQITYLVLDPDRGKAFADTLKVKQQDLASRLRSLTPVQLNWDTRVTSHGFKDGKVTDYQAILQAGTPVMVDDHGVPVVRCTCGNPLSAPDAVNGTPTYSGRQWETFRAAGLVAVVPSDKPMKTLTLYDHDGKHWFERPSGKVEGKRDHKVEPPEGRSSDSSVPVLPSPSTGSQLEPPGTTAPPPGEEKKKEEPPKDESPKSGEPKKEEPPKGEEKSPDKEKGKEESPKSEEPKKEESPKQEQPKPPDHQEQPEKPPSEQQQPQQPERPEQPPAQPKSSGAGGGTGDQPQQQPPAQPKSVPLSPAAPTSG
ncbi:primosomal protein [Streptomyces sp. ME19-03-3]|nr:primosomal protein [Streptomyces sp. ME19-03-3]